MHLGNYCRVSHFQYWLQYSLSTALQHTWTLCHTARISAICLSQSNSTERRFSGLALVSDHYQSIIASNFSFSPAPTSLAVARLQGPHDLQQQQQDLMINHGARATSSPELSGLCQWVTVQQSDRVTSAMRVTQCFQHIHRSEGSPLGRHKRAPKSLLPV
jgi:hypothetical protein